MKKVIVFLCAMLLVFGIVGIATSENANLILNGDFENNGAIATQTNLSNAEFSALVDNAVGFGSSEEIDLFRNGGNPFWGTAQSGNWFLGLATTPTSQPSINTFDAFSFLLSDTVNVGSSYNLSFFARGNPDDPITPIQIGLSNIATDFGILIFTGVATSRDSWDQFNLDFVAQSSASFLTVRTDQNLERHTLVDNFSLTAAPVPEPTIDAILEFFDESVEAGTIVGCGKRTCIANFKLWLFRQTLETAKYFIENDKMKYACKALNRAFLRCDGEPRPKDFVKGEAVSELADMILELMDELGCE